MMAQGGVDETHTSLLPKRKRVKRCTIIHTHNNIITRTLLYDELTSNNVTHNRTYMTVHTHSSPQTPDNPSRASLIGISVTCVLLVVLSIGCVCCLGFYEEIAHRNKFVNSK